MNHHTDGFRNNIYSYVDASLNNLQNTKQDIRYLHLHYLNIFVNISSDSSSYVKSLFKFGFIKCKLKYNLVHNNKQFEKLEK